MRLLLIIGVLVAGLGIVSVVSLFMSSQSSPGNPLAQGVSASVPKATELLLDLEYPQILSSDLVAGQLDTLLAEGDWFEIIEQPSAQLAAAGASDRVAGVLTRAHIELGRLDTLTPALIRLDQAYRRLGKPQLSPTIAQMIYTLAARAAMQADEPGLAAELIDQALAHVGDDLAARNRLLAARGRMYLAHGDTKQALEDWSMAVRMTPEYPWALLARGLYYSQQGDQEQALSDLHQAYLLRDNAPDFFMPTSRYARLLRDKFNVLAARAEWAEGTVYLSMAEPLSSTRDLTLMFESTLRAIDKNFQQGEYFRVMQAANELKFSIEALDSPQLAAIFDVQLAKLVASVGQNGASYEMALVLYEHLIDPQSRYSMALGANGRAELLSTVAALFHINVDLAQMSDALALAAELSPANVRVNKFLGDLSFTLEYYTSAERFYSVALIGAELQRDFRQDYASAKLRRGISNFELQDFSKARDDFDDLLQLSANSDIVRFWRAKTLAALGEQRLAQADFDVSLPTLPRDTLTILQAHLQSKGLLEVHNVGSYDLATRKAVSACIKANCLTSR